MSTSPAHVAFINHTVEIGGAERSLLLLLSMLDRECWRASLLLPAGEGPLPRAARALGIEIVPCAIPYRLPARAPWIFLRGRAAVAASLRRLRPDLVHANSVIPGLLAAPARRGGDRPPVVVHVRDLDLPQHAVATWLLGNCAARLCISRAARQALPPGLRARSRVLHNAVEEGALQLDLSREEARRRLGLAESAGPFLGLMGRLVPEKGFGEAIAALHLLRDQWPAARLLLAGPPGGAPERAFRAELRRRAAALGCAERVIDLGFVEEVGLLLRALDLLLVPSWIEGFGRVAIEGFAAGVPVIAARTGGLIEVIEEEVSGVLVTPRDPVALADAIRRLLRSAELRARLVAGAREALRSRYSAAHQARALAALYAELCASPAATHPRQCR